MKKTILSCIIACLLVFLFYNCSNNKTTTLSLIAEENKKEGTTGWLISVPYDTCSYPNHQNCRREQIEGYCSHESIKAGEQLSIFVSTNPASDYTLDIYRMGYYGGKGGRLMKSFGTLTGKQQVTPAADTQTNFLECKWDTAVSITIPADWVSGVYVGKLTTLKNNDQSYIIFTVKDDRRADFIFQNANLTWQAYNRWPYWHSMYDEGQKPWVNTNGARISFNRPYSLYVNNLPSDFNELSNGAGEFLLWEFPLAFWMEKEGYDVTYITNIDTHADAATLLRGKGFISVGHDEYWTQQMYNNVAVARDAGVSLLFLCGNSVDGKIYLDSATDGRPNRTTGRVPEREFKDEQDLMGASSYGVGYCAFVCKAPGHWLYENTGMKMNDSVTDLVGWEYHGLPVGKAEGLVIVAQNKIPANKFTSRESPDHVATIYETPKGNFVYNAGTCWWSMLLSTPPGFKNPVCNLGSDGNREMQFSKPDIRVQQMTANLLKRCLLKK